MKYTMKNKNERLDKAQARYKKNYDERLRKQSEVIHGGDFLYLKVEQKNPKDHRHKLAQTIEGPYKVNEVDNNTVFLLKRRSGPSKKYHGRESCSLQNLKQIRGLRR